MILLPAQHKPTKTTNLLEVIGKLVHVLIVGQQSMRLSAIEVVVPDSQHGQQDWDISFQRSFKEVFIHLVSSQEEILEVFRSDVKHDGETDGRPKGVSTTDPIPEFEHVCRVDAESGDGGSVGRESNEVLGDVRFLYTQI